MIEDPQYNVARQQKFPRYFAIAGFLSLFAASWLGVHSYLRQTGKFEARSAALLSSLKEGKGDTTRNFTPVLQELEAAPRSLRAAFLRQALATPEGLEVLHAQQNGFVVALSQVDRIEAHALFQDVLKPIIQTSQSPQVLSMAFFFTRRWSIGDALTAEELEELIPALLDRLLNTSDEVRDPELLQTLGTGFDIFADHLPPRIAAQASQKLLDRITTTQNAAALAVFIPLARMFEQNLDSPKADKLASRLVGRMLTERNPYVPRAMVPALEPLAPQVSLEDASAIVQRLVAQLVVESDATLADAQVSAIRIFSGKLIAQPRTDAESNPLASLAQQVLARLQAWPDPDLVTPLVGALRILTSDVPDPARQDKSPSPSTAFSESLLRDAASTLSARVREAQDMRDAATWAVLLGSLKDRPSRTESKVSKSNPKPTPAESVGKRNADEAGNIESTGINDDAFASAASQLVFRMENTLGITRGVEPGAAFPATRDPLTVALGASGLIALSDGIPVSTAGHAATRIDALFVHESDPAMATRLALALQSVVKGWNSEQARAFATRIVERMRNNPGIATLRVLAFALRAVRAQIAPASLNALQDEADKVVADRIQSATFDQLHDLAMDLQILGTRVRPSPGLQRAALHIMDLLNHSTDPGDLAELSAALQSLPLAPGDPAFQSAVQVLEKRLEIERDPTVLRSLTGSLIAFPEAAASLDTGSSERLQPVFTIPMAPCQLVLHFSGDERAKGIAQQLLNPLCAEPDWQRLALDLNGTPFIKDAAEPNIEALIGLDDDDGEANLDADMDLPIDFNRLSDRLAKLRPARAIGSGFAADWAAIALLFLGIALLITASRLQSAQQQKENV